MNEAIETINYKNYTIKIYPDYDAMSPDEWNNEYVFLVGYHDDFWVDKKEFITKDEAIRLAENDIDKEDTKLKQIKKDYHIFGLEAYIHSGVSLYLSYEGNCPDRKWDVCQLGLVFVKRTETKSRIKAKKIAENLLETWNDYLSGNVYGHRVIDNNGNEIHSCWGFYGDYNKSGLLDDAKDMIEYDIEQKQKQKQNKLKALIKNNVPINKRANLLI